MKKLYKNKPLVISLVVLILIFGGLLIAWLSALYALDHMSFRRVTTTQMATAMRQDEFWSSYRFNTLIFNGDVQSVTNNNGQISLGLATNDPYGVSCRLTNSDQKFEIGKTYKFEAETYQAQRQPHGVLLHNCVSP